MACKEVNEVKERRLMNSKFNAGKINVDRMIAQRQLKMERQEIFGKARPVGRIARRAVFYALQRKLRLNPIEVTVLKARSPSHNSHKA